MVSPNRPSYPTTQRTEATPANSNALVTGLLVAFGGLVIPSLIAYGMGTANEVQVVALVLGVLGITLLLARPFFGLLVFAALLYARPEESVKALAGMHFTLIIAVMTLLGLLIQMALDKMPFVRAPSLNMVSAFAFTATVSAVFNGIGFMPALDLIRLVMVVFLILNIIRSPDRYRQFASTLIFFTTYLALYSSYLYFSGTATFDNGTLRSRGTGIFSDPNDLAATMVLGLALTLSRFINSRGKMRVFYAVPVVIILGAILLTHSRGGLIALMTVMFLYFLVSSRRKVLAIVLAVVCCGVVVIAAPGRMTNFDTQEQSANSRFHFWNEGIHQLVGHPVLGIGYGKFPDVNDGFVAHNSFVNCFAEQGLIGYFFWMGCIYFAFRQRSKGIPEPPAPESAATELIGARIALAGYLSAGFWITRCYTPIMYIALALPVAQQLAYSGLPTLTLFPESERLSNYGRICALCIGSIILVWILVLRFK